MIGRRYILNDELGSGGMGTVYRATDRLTGQRVALKRVLQTAEPLLFASETEQDTDARLMLAREFQSLASLRHPNIIGVLDYGFDAERQPYFTMELLEPSLNIREAGRRGGLEFQVNLLTQMLLALAYLHRRGVLHRDLKPGNVLVADGVVKVLDFGLATTTNRATGTSGTLAYMAPEVMRGGVSSPVTDLYAVGVIAYEVFAGHHPFSIHQIDALINEIAFTMPNVRG